MTDDEEIVLAPLELKNDGFEPDYRIKFQVSLLSAGGENCSCYAPLRS
jgi:hypothetical protein